jgi:aryl-alcohol dehydrogenase-like predicted oxidoreductase
MLVSEQSIYNLMERTAELEVIPACQSYGLGLIPWSPLAGAYWLDRLKEQGRGVELKVTFCWDTIAASYVSEKSYPVADVRKLLRRFG